MGFDVAAAITKLRGMKALFTQIVKETSSFHNAVCTIVDSTSADEQYGMLGQVPLVQELIGDRDWEEYRAVDWTIKNKTWADSLLIKKERIEDDQLGFYASTLAKMAVRAARHPDSLLFKLIADGEMGECFDGQNFYDTDHRWGSSGAQSNSLTFGVANINAITPAEFKSAYHKARATLLGFRDDRGELINEDIATASDSLAVFYHIDMEEIAETALAARLVPTGGDNIVIGSPKTFSSARMGSAVKFDVFKIDEPLKPFIYQRRTKLEREMKGMKDLEFNNVKFMTRARYNLGYSAWWLAVRITFVQGA